jgi:hypothetical protein
MVPAQSHTTKLPKRNFKLEHWKDKVLTSEHIKDIHKRLDCSTYEKVANTSSYNDLVEARFEKSR